MNKLQKQIEKILGNKIEDFGVRQLTDCMIDIQLNKKQERLTIYAQDIREIEKLGLKLWNINFDLKTITFDIK